MLNTIKKPIILAVAALLLVMSTLPVYAAEPAAATNNAQPNASASTTSGSPLLDDKAGLLTSSEAPQVLETLEKASSDANCNIAVATTNQGLNESAIVQYSNSYFENNLHNKTQTNYTILLTVDISSRKVDVRGYNPGSSQTITSEEGSEIREAITGDLSDGNYAKAFTKFASESKSMALSIDENGKKAFPWLKRILISLVIAIIIALIVCLIIKKQLTTVEMNDSAAEYIREGSFNLTKQRDTFLYSHVSKTAKPKNTSSGGGRSSGSGSTGSF